jgi:hypothetical protein
MRDLTRRQIRVLFELSNGKRLYVNEAAGEAYLSDDGPRHNGYGDGDQFQNFVSLRTNDCLIRQGRGTVHATDSYTISPEGIERLLESSMRPEEG